MKRVVIKKGRKIFSREPKFVLKLSKKIYNELKKESHRISFAGSIRRKSKTPTDIDIVLIPKNKEKINELLLKMGKRIAGGEKRLTFNIEGVKVEIYFADKEDWGAMLFAYSAPSGASIGLRKIARDKGYLLNQYGLYARKSGKKIAGKTETEIYSALGKKYKSPERR